MVKVGYLLMLLRPTMALGTFPRSFHIVRSVYAGGLFCVYPFDGFPYCGVNGFKFLARRGFFKKSFKYCVCCLYGIELILDNL